jgi:hypothetical protein
VNDFRFICPAKEAALKGLKLLVNVTPTLDSSVKMVGFADDADAIPTPKIPSVAQAIAVAVIAIFLIISILFLSSRFWPTFFDRVGLYWYFRGRLDAF